MQLAPILVFQGKPLGSSKQAPPSLAQEIRTAYLPQQLLGLGLLECATLQGFLCSVCTSMRGGSSALPHSIKTTAARVLHILDMLQRSRVAQTSAKDTHVVSLVCDRPSSWGGGTGTNEARFSYVRTYNQGMDTVQNA